MAFTEHAWLLLAATVSRIPCRKGSVFEAGSVSSR
jgi:hypothetical protein